MADIFTKNEFSEIIFLWNREITKLGIIIIIIFTNDSQIFT